MSLNCKEIKWHAKDFKGLTIGLITSLLMACIGSFAQTRSSIDSLKNSLALAKADTSLFRIYNSLGRAYQYHNLDSAIQYSQLALMLARKLKSPEREADALDAIAWEFRQAGNAAKSLEIYFKLLRLAEANNLLKKKATALFLIGTEFRRGLNDYEGSFKYLKRAREVSLAIQDSLTYIQIEGEFTLLFIMQNQLDSAEYYASKTLRRAEEKKIYYTATLANLYLGIIGNQRQETYQALAYFRKALSIASRFGFASLISRIDQIMAQTHYRLGNIDSAIYYSQQGLAKAKEVRLSERLIENADFLSELYEKIDISKSLLYSRVASAARDSLFNSSNVLALKSITEFDEQERQYELKTAQDAYQNKVRQYALLSGLGVFLMLAFILLHSNRQKQRANKILKQTLSDLKSTQSQLIHSEKMASLGELTAGIAHEIQNPLNFVNNFSEVSNELLDEMVEEVNKGNYNDTKAIAEDVKQNLEKILHHGKRADGIVKGMLQHSRSSSGQKELTDINALCDEYLRLSYHGLRAKDKSFNAKFELQLNPTLPKLNVVPQDIGRVILNLINNAFYAVNEKRKTSSEEYEPTVLVSTKKEGDKVLILVKDNGNGIPDSIKEKIFQPFFTTKPTGQGTGLGLSLSYDIVKAHRGELQVESKENEFTVLKVILPTNQ